MSVVAGAGHSPHRDKPEATIAEFLKSSAAARRGIASLHDVLDALPDVDHDTDKARNDGGESFAESSIGGTDPSSVVTSSVAVSPLHSTS